MSGKWILSLMIAGCVAMAALFYFSLKQAPALKSQVGEQMASEFRQYSHEQQKDQLKVTETNSESYFVDTQAAPWSFDIQDKILVVTAPIPIGAKSHELLTPDALMTAKGPIEELVWSWVDQKFHSRKDLKLEIHFLNEPPIK